MVLSYCAGDHSNMVLHKPVVLPRLVFFLLRRETEVRWGSPSFLFQLCQDVIVARGGGEKTPIFHSLAERRRPP